MPEKKQFDRDVMKRLMAYSAAAGAGAFACGQEAGAAIVYTDIPDVTILRGDPSVSFNIDAFGYNDFSVLNTSGGGPYGVGTVQFRGLTGYGATDLSNAAKGSTYYVRSFDAGDLIGPDNPNAQETGSVGVVSLGTFVDPNKYGGLKFTGGDGMIHYGWVRFQTNTSSSSTTDRTVTVFDFAYETAPDTSIEAGAVPEPASLGLLAIGAGALAFRRRTA
jgi:hypothetical protein